MLPVQVPDVAIYAGDTVEFPQYSFQGENEESLNLSGYTWRAQWRAAAVSKTAIELEVDDTDAAEGILRVRASSANTAAMNSSGVWDLQATDGDTVTTWLRGKTVLTRDVTRD